MAKLGTRSEVWFGPDYVDGQANGAFDWSRAEEIFHLSQAARGGAAAGILDGVKSNRWHERWLRSNGRNEAAWSGTRGV